MLADKSINDKVEPGTWEGVRDLIRTGISGQKHCKGICEAVMRVGNILARDFPRKADDVNELPNKVDSSEK